MRDERDCASGPYSHLSSLISALHRDQRGNLGTLLLMTIWVLVAILALVWNTGEVATRRQNLQTAADTSAHATATWMSRCVNAIAAQNMVICQDASMETIWRAVPPTDQRVSSELESELAAVTNLLNGQDPAQQQLRNRMLRELANVDNQFAEASGALSDVNAASNQAFADPQDAKTFLDGIRQATAAMGWVQSTYVGGGAPAAATWPGPPGPGGQGLRQLVEQWSPPTNDKPILQAIIASLQQQLAVLAELEARTASATSQDVAGNAASHEAEVYANEQAMAQQLTDTIQQQLQKQEDLYNVRLTIGTTGQGAQPSGPAQVQAPVIPASFVQGQSHVDSISGETVTIDPINVQCDNSEFTTNPQDDAAIKYPNVQAPVPADILALYPRMPAAFGINCNIPGGWGHLFCAPLYGYFQQRVARDRQGLLTYMQQIDALRQQLAQLLRQLRGLGAMQNIASLPGQLSDSVPDAQGNFPKIDVLPRLTAPAGATADLQSPVTLYNQHGAAYTGAVRQLANALSSWAQQYDRYTRPFAVSTWNGSVDAMRNQVLQALGNTKQFMVLAPYQLQAVPDWASQGMSVSATAAIRDQIVKDNIAPVSRAVLNAMVAADPKGAGRGFLDSNAGNGVMSATYSPQASQIAFEIVNTTAAEVAPIIAAEWVSRPWAYEITPPDQSVPPSVGMTTADRQDYFTVLTAARPSDQNTPKLFMAKLMGNPATPQLLAYAQAETFNWMEFNAAYGGSERFDQVTWGTVADFVGSPVPWRLSTIGGWSWNPRLAVSDALAPTLDNSPEFNSFFQEGGITSSDPQAMQALALH